LKNSDGFTTFATRPFPSVLPLVGHRLILEDGRDLLNDEADEDETGDHISQALSPRAQRIEPLKSLWNARQMGKEDNSMFRGRQLEYMPAMFE
jgi:hypothetical protein